MDRNRMDAHGSVLSGAGTVVGAIAVIVAAKFASNTFEEWRRQKLPERRIEQAERILTATYKARRALEHVRSPIMFSHEQVTAEKHLEQQDYWKTIPADRRRKLITAQGYYNRLNLS
jgi:hypothetical protein